MSTGDPMIVCNVCEQPYYLFNGHICRGRQPQLFEHLFKPVPLQLKGKCFRCSSEYFLGKGHNCMPENPESRMGDDGDGQILPSNIFNALMEKGVELDALRNFGYEAYKYFKDQLSKEEFKKLILPAYRIVGDEIYSLEVVRFKTLYIDARRPCHDEILTTVVEDPVLLTPHQDIFFHYQDALDKLYFLLVKKLGRYESRIKRIKNKLRQYGYFDK